MHNPTIKETDLQRVYAMYEDKSVTLDQFREAVFSYMLNARKPNYTQINNLKNAGRDALMQSFNNFAFKGQGHGVI